MLIWGVALRQPELPVQQSGLIALLRVHCCSEANELILHTENRACQPYIKRKQETMVRREDSRKQKINHPEIL